MGKDILREFGGIAESNAITIIYKKRNVRLEESSNDKAMEMSPEIEEMKAKADEIYHGDEECREKSKSLLREMGLPSGLLPLKDMEEFGRVRATGFVWFKQKQSINHRFVKIGKLVSYSTEITAFMEKHRIKKLTGVKSKELSIWLKLSEIFIGDPADHKITFQIQSGLGRSYPISPFEDEDDSVKQLNEDDEQQKAAAAMKVDAV